MARLAAADPDRALGLLAEMSAASDRRLAALAARLAGRIALDIAGTGAADSHGVGKLVSGRASRHDGDIDVDKSVEALARAAADAKPVHSDELWVRFWQKSTTAIAAVVDRSGSMGGSRLAVAAVAAAACALRAPAQWSVLAFGAEVVALKSVDQHRRAEAVVEDVLRLRGYGTTNLAAALRAAQGQLQRALARRKVTLLLSDCRATTGDDALAAARQLDELCVLAPASDAEDARSFAAAAGARLALIDTARTVPEAVSEVLS